MDQDPPVAGSILLREFLSALGGLDQEAWRGVAERHLQTSGDEEVEAARLDCRRLASEAGRLGEWKRAGDRAWEAARGADSLRGATARRSAHLEARAAARLAAGALVVRDLLGEGRFELVYGPLAPVVPSG
ncbi:MAG: hypothetical protein ACREPI_05230 [Candidatus Dormibacterales bacterium]